MIDFTPFSDQYLPKSGIKHFRRKRDKKFRNKRFCQICEKYIYWRNYHKHMRTHLGKFKPIVCPICQKRFYLIRDLEKHTTDKHEKLCDGCSNPMTLSYEEYWCILCQRGISWRYGVEY